MHSVKPQEPPHDAATELIEWALTVLILALAMGGIWVISEVVR